MSESHIGAVPSPLPTLRGNGVSLSSLELSHVSARYVDWMNNPEIVRFTESRFTHHTIETLKEYADIHRKDPNTALFAMIEIGEGLHIGNIKLGPIDWYHGFGDMALIVGDQRFWGAGIATEAIRLVRDFAFQDLRLHKLTAGMYRENVGSRRAFEKCGFRCEGTRASQYRDNGGYTDLMMLGCIAGQGDDGQ